MENKRTKKNAISKSIVTVLMMIYFVFCGAAAGTLLDSVLPKKASGLIVFISVVCAILILYLALFIQICIHEIGHMVFGLISGYRFISIRFGSIIFYKTEKGLKVGKYTLAGTGGQCVMYPPEKPIEEIPTALYNWGGVLFNLILSLVCGLVWLIPGVNPYVRFVCALVVLVGIFTILTNGIPVEAMSNDGYNAITLGKDLKAKRSFIVSFKMLGDLQLGLSPKDFPKEWFEWSYEPGDSSLASSLGMQKLSWLILNEQFEKAYELGDFIDKNVTNLGATSEMVVKMETLFSMIMIDKDKEEIKEKYKKQEKNFKLLKNIPSTQRTLYAYNKLIVENTKEAELAKNTFDSIAKKYPYPAEIEAERDLLKLVDEKTL